MASRAIHRLPADPVIVRQNWLSAYGFITDKGAVALNDYARASDPFGKVGKIQVAVDISSVIRASTDSFRVAWTERRDGCRPLAHLLSHAKPIPTGQALVSARHVSTRLSTMTNVTEPRPAYMSRATLARALDMACRPSMSW